MTTDRLDAAFVLAHRVHRAQARKGGSVPYIGHLMAVSSITLEYGGTEDQAVAALLHDTLEDTTDLAPDALRLMIRDAFGDAVLRIVEDCTDTDVKPKPAWRTRKERYVAHTREEAHPTSLLVSAADKLHNALTILREHRNTGNRVFDRFKASRDDVLWYYRELALVFEQRLENPIAADLTATVNTLIASVKTRSAAGARRH